MTWEAPKNSGTGPGPLKAAGSRWTTALTADIHNVAHHARTAQLLEGVTRELRDQELGTRRTWSANMYVVMPVDDIVYKPPPGAPVPEPFADALPHVCEMIVSRAATGKQVLFQRRDYAIPRYGVINEDAHFRASAFTHCGLIPAGSNTGVLDFYESTLGLLRSIDRSGPAEGPATSAVFETDPGE